MTKTTAELAVEWRERAVGLRKYAQRMRNQHDPREAEDAEQAALDYDIAAEDLELQSSGFAGHPVNDGKEAAEPAADDDAAWRRTRQG